MKKKCVKATLFASCIFAFAGIICFIVKLIEATMRTEHEWAQTFLTLGFVFLGVALLILVAMVVVDSILQKRNDNVEISDEQLLEKYKSKKNR